MNATDVAEAIERRYGTASQERQGEKWICIREARAGAGFEGNNGSCDLLAINTWRSQGMQLIGHEIKVSYSDWKNELVDPDKAERFAKYCRRWWVAAPSDLAKKINPELPPTWGLLSVGEKQTRELISAPIREPEPVPAWWWVGWLAQLDRRDKRLFTTEVNKQVSQRVNETLEQERARQPVMTHQDQLDLRNLREWKKQVDAFTEETGVSILELTRASVDQVQFAMKFARWDAPRVGMLIDHLRKLADVLDSAPEAEDG